MRLPACNCNRSTTWIHYWNSPLGSTRKGPPIGSIRIHHQNKQGLPMRIDKDSSIWEGTKLILKIWQKTFCLLLSAASPNLGYWVMFRSVIRGGISKTLGRFRRCGERSEQVPWCSRWSQWRLKVSKLWTSGSSCPASCNRRLDQLHSHNLFYPWARILHI